MASAATSTEFVNMVAEEIAIAIDRALGYWLGRIEIEVIDRSLTPSERMFAIEQVLGEYKQLSGKAPGSGSA